MIALILDNLLWLLLLCHRHIFSRVHQTLTSTSIWSYFYGMAYSMVEFDKDTIPFTNFGYEVRVDPANDIIDEEVEKRQEELRTGVLAPFQTQWRSVNLYAAVLSLPDIYWSRLRSGKFENEKGSVLDGKRCLEVGCGRGGGCLVLYSISSPASYTGVDISDVAVARSGKRIESSPKLANEPIDFKAANSMELEQHLPKNSFDVVYNVESSHCYSDLLKFFQSVHAVLKPGGVFLWADMQYPGAMSDIKHAMNSSGLRIKACHEINRNVSQSLKNGELGPIDQLYDAYYSSQAYIPRMIYYIFWRLCSHVAPYMLHRNSMTYHTVICEKVVGEELLDLQKMVTY